MLATYWPIFTLTLLGDAPEAAALPAQATFDLNAFLGGLPPWAQAALIAGVTAIAGYIGSVIVSFWSDYVRRLGPKAAPWMLSLSAALNVAAGNPHKAARAQKAAKGPKATHRCKVCGSLWRKLGPEHGGGWSLAKGALVTDLYPTGRAGECCDNVAMGEQIEELS